VHVQMLMTLLQLLLLLQWRLYRQMDCWMGLQLRIPQQLGQKHQHLVAVCADVCQDPAARWWYTHNIMVRLSNCFQSASAQQCSEAPASHIPASAIWVTAALVSYSRVPGAGAVNGVTRAAIYPSC
jgi:hypothetical protein